LKNPDIITWVAELGNTNEKENAKMFKRGSILVFALMVTATVFMYANAVKAQLKPVTDGLVSYWSFDANAVTPKTAKDVWGSNHGSIEGEPQLVDGKVGKALEFNGVDDYIEVPHDASLDITGGITVEAWVRGADAVGYKATFRTILAKDVHQSQPYGFYWDNVNGELEFVINDAGSRLTVPFDYAGKVGEWVHVAATYDEKEIKIYADGDMLQSKDISKPLITDDASLWIAYDGDFNDPDGMIDRYFPGAIDELRIYNRVLSEKEIQQNFVAEGLAVQPSVEKLTVTWGKIKASR